MQEGGVSPLARGTVLLIVIVPIRLPVTLAMIVPMKLPGVGAGAAQ